MARRHIFEILEENIDLYEEVDRLERLAKMDIVTLDDIFENNLETFIDECGLGVWKNRNRFISYQDMRVKLDITEFQMRNRPAKEQVLLYFEFMANMLFVCKLGFESYTTFEEYQETDAFKYIGENLNIIVSSLNMELKTFEEQEKVLLVEKDPAATAVAEIVEPELAYQVIEYNHYLLKGDIEGKQKILKFLADKFEAIRPEVKSINPTLESNTGYLLNKMNIRHNNVSGKNAIPYVKNMSEKDLENWYDEIYQMILLAILEVDNIERNKKVKDLKQIIQGK